MNFNHQQLLHNIVVHWKYWLSSMLFPLGSYHYYVHQQQQCRQQQQQVFAWGQKIQYAHQQQQSLAQLAQAYQQLPKPIPLEQLNRMAATTGIANLDFSESNQDALKNSAFIRQSLHVHIEARDEAVLLNTLRQFPSLLLQHCRLQRNLQPSEHDAHLLLDCEAITISVP